ncbi:sulfite exporter TauE/SafE family protein [Peptococcaceae bacterium 1198_IL3148]
MRRLYTALMAASRSYAKWDYENSMSIIRDRKRLLLLLLMALPILLPALAHAASALPEALGGKTAYAPSFFSAKVFYASIGIGLCAGLITGCIGAGGGFIITPALMSVGVKGILAVGTDQFHIFAKSIMGTAVHRKLGNVHVGLALAFLCGSCIGVTAGGTLNRALYEYNPILSDFAISLVYVVMLGFLSAYALADYFKNKNAEDAHGGGEQLTGLAKGLQKANLPPMIKFDEHVVPGGRKISGWFVALCGSVVGLAASIMGVGGGFLTFPMFVYGLGVSTGTTVGTDILQIIFTAGYSAISQYAIYGYVFYTLAMGMLVGSLVGVQLGALTTKVVSGGQIKAFYAVTILAAFINRVFALPDKLVKMEYISLSSKVSSMLNTVGTVVFFGIIIFFAVWVISKFVANIGKLKAAAANGVGGGGGKGVSQ